MSREKRTHVVGKRKRSRERRERADFKRRSGGFDRDGSSRFVALQRKAQVRRPELHVRIRGEGELIGGKDEGARALAQMHVGRARADASRVERRPDAGRARAAPQVLREADATHEASHVDAVEGRIGFALPGGGVGVDREEPLFDAGANDEVALVRPFDDGAFEGRLPVEKPLVENGVRFAHENGERPNAGALVHVVKVPFLRIRRLCARSHAAKALVLESSVRASLPRSAETSRRTPPMSYSVSERRRTVNCGSATSRR